MGQVQCGEQSRISDQFPPPLFLSPTLTRATKQVDRIRPTISTAAIFLFHSLSSHSPMTITMATAICIVAAAALFAVSSAQNARQERVNVNVYIEAQCPFSTKFMANQLMPFVRKYRDLIELRVIPHGNTVCHKGVRRIHCTCFHGFDECQLNQLMNCAIQRYPYIYDHLDLVACVQGQPDLATAQNNCLRGREDESALLKCTKSYKGRKLLLESGYKTNRAGVNIVPWVTLNGWFNDPASAHFEREVCRVSPYC